MKKFFGKILQSGLTAFIIGIGLIAGVAFAATWVYNPQTASNGDPLTVGSWNEMVNAIEELQIQADAAGASGDDEHQYVSQYYGAMKIIDGDLYAKGYNQNCTLGLTTVNAYYNSGLYLTLTDVVKVYSIGYSSGFYAERTDGSIWVNGLTAYNMRGNSYGDCGWVQFATGDESDTLITANKVTD